MKRAGLVGLVGLAGCFEWSSLPNDRADPHLRKITEAQILDMNVNLFKQPGLCPGAEGKLYVNAKVQWPGAQPVPRSLGSDVDSLQPEAFSIKGPLIRGDAQAHLFPDPDVLKSVETGFETDIVYRPQPRFHFHEVFPPEYSCYTGWAQEGGGGGGGASGYGGSGGGQGRDGGHGEPGGRGGRGENGGRITVYVTVVSTRFYQRLLAVIANDTFFLAPADRALTFDVAGGAGGPGGTGGNGGNGGDQKVVERQEHGDNDTVTTVRVGEGRAGNGGNGASGGYGGDGGNGGTVEITYDGAFPELRDLMLTNVDGGPGGDGGAGGNGGAGGGTNAEKGAEQGGSGGNGDQGGSGHQGGRGQASIHAGSVGRRFSNMRGITVLGSGSRR